MSVDFADAGRMLGGCLVAFDGLWDLVRCGPSSGF